MFSTLLQELKEYFGREFLLSAFFPVALFTGLSLALYAEIRWGLVTAVERWEELSATLRLLLSLTTLVAIIVVAYLLYSGQYVLVRLFEGYWPRWLHSLRNSRARFYRQRWKYLEALARDSATPPQEANEIWAELLVYYPPPTHLDAMMPTRLGNILRAAEIYPYERYGLDAAIIWPRLRPLLKPEIIALLADRKMSMTFMLSMSLLAALFSLIWCPILAIWTSRLELFLLIGLGWPLAWFCYQSALQSAVAYGEQLRATFDLYRHELLKALKREVPTEINTERREWKRLTRFFFRNIPLPPPGEPPSPARQERPVSSSTSHWSSSRPTKDSFEDAKPKRPCNLFTWFLWGLWASLLALGFLWIERKPDETVLLPVPVRDLPAYYVIAEEDLTMVPFPSRQIANGTILTAKELVGQLTREPLLANQPIRREQVVGVPDPVLVQDAFAVGIPADEATILGGALRPGDVVTLAVMPSQNVDTPTVLLDTVLVLDIRSQDDTGVVVVAVPATRWSEYLAARQKGDLILARPVGPSPSPR